MPLWSKAPTTKLIYPCLCLSSCAPKAPQESCFPVLGGHKFLLSFHGQRYETCLGVLMPLAHLLPDKACCSPWPLARGQGQGSSHVTPQRQPVLPSPCWGLNEGCRAWPSRLSLYPAELETAAWQALGPGDRTGLWTRRQGASLFSWKMPGMFQSRWLFN